MDTFKVLGFAVLVSMVAAAPPLPLLDDMFCHVCVDAADNNDCNNTISCDVGHTHCLTEMFYDDGAITIEKRCAKMQVCYNMEENNAEGCDNPDDRTEGYCAYCCSTPGCNAELPPYNDNESDAPAPDSENDDDDSCEDDDDEAEDDDDDDDDSKPRRPCNKVLRPTHGPRPASHSSAVRVTSPGRHTPNSGGGPAQHNSQTHGLPQRVTRPDSHKPNSQVNPTRRQPVRPQTSRPASQHKPNSQTSRPATHRPRQTTVKPASQPKPNSQVNPTRRQPVRPQTSRPASQPKPNSQVNPTRSQPVRPQTSSPATHRPRQTTVKPSSQPPVRVTQPPTNNGGATVAPTSAPSGGSQASTCHCHNGQPCTQVHVQPPASGGNTGSQLFPGLNIDLSIHISGGKIDVQPQSAASCPCQQQANQQVKSSPAPTAGPTSATTQPGTVTIPPDTPRTAATTAPSAATAPPATAQHATTAAPATPAPATTTKKPTAATAAATTAAPATPVPTTSTKKPAVTTAAPTTTKKPAATATIPPDTTLSRTTAPPPTAAPTTTTPAPTTTTTTTTTTPAPTTTTTTTTTPAPTTTTTTTTTPAPTTTTPPGPTQCYHCHDTQCRDQYLRTCPTGYNYCMNRISQRIDGTRTFEKSCVPTATCDTQWWRKTAGLADCFLLDDSARGRPGNPLSACSFCCHGNGCNQHTIPDLTSLYDPNKMP